MLFKILFIGASATTGIFAGLWWAERYENEILEMRLESLRKAHRRARDKMTVEQLFALMQDQINDIKFHEIVRDQ